MSSTPINRFEDFIAWQRARALTAKIYKASNSGSFAQDFALRNQIRRAAISIMANIAEGFERGRPTEFHQFLSVAKGSAAEVRAHLYVALDAGHISQGCLMSCWRTRKRLEKSWEDFATRSSDGETADPQE